MNSKTTKRALLGSFTSLLLCFAMLIGSTFAWFTDTATTGVNEIKAGTLKVDIVDGEGTSIKGQSISFVNKEGKPNILWEPGATFRTTGFQIKNGGSLALKYKLTINGITGDAELLKAIDFKLVKANGTDFVDATADGVRLVANTTDETVYYIQGTMKATAGNECQGKTLTGVGITVLATQDTVEVDSKDNQYDKDAEYAELKTAEELKTALTPTGSSNSVSLDSDIVLTEEWEPLTVGTYQQSGYPNTEELVIDGQGHTIYGLTAALVKGNAAKHVTIKNLTIADSNITSDNPLGSGAFVEGIYDGGTSLTLENCHAVNVTVAGEKTGTAALVGYISCDSATIKNCSVENCTVNASSNAAGIVGYTSATSVTVESCSVIDSKFTSTDDGAWRVGAVVGTVGAGEVTISGCTESGNTYTQANANTVATSNLYGRVVGNGSLTNN